MQKTVSKKTAPFPSSGQPLKSAKHAGSKSHTKSCDVCNPDVYAGINLLDILNALPFYVIIVDADHHILEANESVYSHLGVNRADVLGKYCPKIIHGTEGPFDGCPLEEAVLNNQAVEREITDPESGRIIRSSIYPLKALTREGKRTFLHMVTDITEHKQTEAHLRSSLEQLRVLSAHLETVREEEKRKIATDLHDETSQLLASLNALLEAAVGSLPAGANKSEGILRKAQSISITILDDLHKLIYNLRPSVLDKFGLRAAISALIDSHLKVAGLSVTFKSSGSVMRLLPSIEIAVYRVVQEAFNNIVKHSRASDVIVKVNFKRTNIKILIEDDGAGYDIENATNPGIQPCGLGLLGMKERMELVNGSLKIKSRLGWGTQIIIGVPLKIEDNDGKD